MTQHLSKEQISELLIQRESGEGMEHVKACPSCQAELAELGGAISSFAAAAREWSETQDSREMRLAPADGRRRLRLRRWYFGWGFVTAIVLLFFFWGFFQRKHEREQTAALNAQSDDLLLQQIDAEVSRRAPAAMDPLVKAITASADGAASENTNSNSQGRGETQ